MSAAHIPAVLMDLLETDALGHLATVRANGTPHVTPLWVDHDGDTVLVNVRLDRVKAANMRERPDVAISIVDPRNPYRYLTITGRVVSWSEDGWQPHMNELSRRYMKLDRYPWFFPGERRAIFRIDPTHVYYETGET
ncbi:MAG TPA: PPOX class F420-dependent oxidoreductase [Candidatus Nitrosopolaris sp.]|nr:PPOX class F420-dependent oxidoreductase [Candidatus Nitrosopolaris sp.]